MGEEIGGRGEERRGEERRGEEGKEDVNEGGKGRSSEGEGWR